MAALTALVIAPSGFAEEAAESDTGADGIIDALIHGKPTLNVRARVELGKSDPLERSEAYTVRTRLGYGTKPWYGVRVYTNFENIAAATTNTYFDATDTPNTKNQTTIADPPGTELNEGFLEIDRPDWLHSRVRAGRQAIVYDNARFIGDIPWRQNQQTFDGVAARSGLGLDDFTLKYGWIGNVNRIFGGGGSNDALRDFQSSSHIINASYKGIEQAQITAFVYLLDLENSQAGDPGVNSSQTYGFRVTGDFDLTEKLVLDYVASYAYQADFAGNPTPGGYSANYVEAGTGFKWKGLGRLGAGFEMLGSDDGKVQFGTPISTAHKFNGWADVYLNNGGPTGLRDLYVAVTPDLPWKLQGSMIYHRFWDDFSGDVRGNEFDAILKRPFGKHLLALAKGAYFKGDEEFSTPDPDTWRFSFEFVVTF